jgi:3-hydroxy-3-methylglutaryl CoA synthase/uncharacterized OB-fold protein
VRLAALGVHVPRYRLSAAEAAEFWGGTARPNTRAVANWDEDVVTMAAEAARRCLDGVDPGSVGALFLASTTFPYAEKQSAALVAEALDLPRDVDVFDVGSSLRAGAQALRLAGDRVRATGQRVLVVAADVRLAAPESGQEGAWGEAAVAALVAAEGPVELRWVAGGYESWLSTWRLAGERYGHEADARFVATLAERSLREAVERAGKAAADNGTTASRVAIAFPLPRVAQKAAAAAGIEDAGAVFGPALQGSVGYTGAAAPLLSLAAALEEAPAGEAVAWVSWGDGTDAALAVVREAGAFGPLVSRAVGAGRPLPYGRYLRIREVVPDAPVAPFSSEIAQWRDADHTARLRAARCRHCGHVTYPPQPVCPRCHRHDDMDEHPLPRSGRLFTFTVEHLYPNPERRLVMGVVELDDGVRFYCPVADVAPDELHIGMPVRLTYRRLHQGGNYLNYFWKAVPAEEEVDA